MSIATDRLEGVGGGRVEAGDQDGMLGGESEDADLRGQAGSEVDRGVGGLVGVPGDGDGGGGHRADGEFLETGRGMACPGLRPAKIDDVSDVALIKLRIIDDLG